MCYADPLCVSGWIGWRKEPQLSIAHGYCNVTSPLRIAKSIESRRSAGLSGTGGLSAMLLRLVGGQQEVIDRYLWSCFPGLVWDFHGRGRIAVMDGEREAGSNQGKYSGGNKGGMIGGHIR
jgi:hypothetical protein